MPDKFWMGYYGFYEPAPPGKIFQQGIRHTRLATDDSSNGYNAAFSGSLPWSLCKTWIDEAKSILPKPS